MDKIREILVRYEHKSQSLVMLSEALHEIVNTVSLDEYLSNILNDEQALSTISKMSYKHDNGFYKIVLCATSYYKLRLHIWDSKVENNAQENIHNHRWDFASYILVGGYDNELYIDSKDEDFKFCYSYYPRLEKNIYRLQYRGEVQLSLALKQQLKAHDYLILDSNSKHRVSINGNFYTATLFLAGSPIKDHTLIYSDKLISNHIEVNSPNITIFDLEARLNELLNKI